MVGAEDRELQAANRGESRVAKEAYLEEGRGVLEGLRLVRGRPGQLLILQLSHSTRRFRISRRLCRFFACRGPLLGVGSWEQQLDLFGLLHL